MLREEQRRLARRRAKRLEIETQLAQFESTVEAALEVTSFPTPTLDTAERLASLQREGDAQCARVEASTDAHGAAASASEMAVP